MPEFVPSESQLRELLLAAVLAPSADNRHIFVWEQSAGALLLRRRPQRDAATLPHQALLDDISLGAVSINLELRAASLGLALRCEWLPQNRTAGALLARIEFCGERHAVDDVLWQAIASRHSNRSPWFSGPPLQQPALGALADDASAEGATLHWLDGDRRRHALAAMRIAETARFRDPQLHRELFGAIQRGESHQQTTLPSEGLPLDSLGLTAFERIGFLWLRHWPVQRAANLLGLHHLMGIRSAVLPCRWAPHLGTISCDAGQNNAAFAVGRALQRVWLHATAMGMSFQVLAAGPIYANSDSRDHLAPGTVSRLRQHWAAACSGMIPLLAFRMGVAKTPTGRAGRPDIAMLQVQTPGVASRPR